MPEEKIGVVIHFFAKPMVAAIKLGATLKAGDIIHVKGAHADFSCPVDSIQIDRTPVQSAEAGADVGVRLTARAHEGDEVFKVTP